MRTEKLKGVTPIISSILLVGVLAAVTGVAWQWGVPIIQKNLDVSTLTKAENFISNLDDKINNVAESGSTEEIIFDLPGDVRIDPESDRIEISLITSGSIYAPGGFVCFSRNCNLEGGTFGDDSYSVVGVQTSSDESNALTTFSIIQRNLTSPGKVYQRNIITPDDGVVVGGRNSRFIISKESENRTDSTTIITVIKIDVI